MRKEIDGLLASHKKGQLSRRQLAAGLSGITLATWGLTSAKVDAQSLRLQAPRPSADIVPTTVGAGADDYAAIQNAIDLVAAIGGGRVIIQEPLLVGSTLTLRTGVELFGEGRIAASIGAHSTFSNGSLIQVEEGSNHIVIQNLTLNSNGRCFRAIVEFGAGCNRIWINGVRFTGWSASTPGVTALHLDTPPGVFGSGRTQEVLIETCEFHSVGHGVQVGQGASHVAILRCHFSEIHRRAIWLFGESSLSSQHVRFEDNTILDFPLDPGMSNPIFLGTLNSERHEFISIKRNVIIGNGDFHGPGGYGTADHYSFHCVHRSQVVGNISIDCGETGFTFRDCSDLLVLGNWSVTSDVAGFVILSKYERCRRQQFIGNYVQNNGQNKGGNTPKPYVQSGFLMRAFGPGIADTHFLGNYAWDNQKTKTQQYALAIEHATIVRTHLTGNFWRDTLHAAGTIYNRGRLTDEAQYSAIRQDPEL